MPQLFISVSNSQPRKVPKQELTQVCRGQRGQRGQRRQPPPNASLVNKKQYGLICRNQFSDEPTERPHLKSKRSKFSQAVGVPGQWSCSPAFEAGKESKKSPGVSTGAGREPHRTV